MLTETTLVLRGVSGVFDGEQYLLGEGTSCTVGRSRSCDVSAARTRSYQRIGAQVLNRSRGFLKMSRRHFLVQFEGPGCVRVRDLSTNGVRIDGERVTEVVFNTAELSRRRVLITFGDGEAFLLSCLVGPREPRVVVTTDSSSGAR